MTKPTDVHHNWIKDVSGGQFDPAAHSSGGGSPEDGSMVMPQDSITGQDPNVVHFPEDVIKGNAKPDDETQKVMAASAAVRTRALTYLNGHMTQIIMAADAFKGAAQSEIDALSSDPSDLTGAVGPLLSVIGAVVTGLFPPAAGFVVATVFVANMTNAAGIAGVKAEGGKAKQALKDGMQNFATAVSNAASKAGAAEANSMPTRLTNLAVSDKNVWNMLVIGGDRQIDNVVAQLGIADPAKQSPYREVLAALMTRFNGWLAKAKWEMGKTGFEKAVAEGVPYDDSFRDLHNQIKQGESDGSDQARKMADDHEKPP